MGIGGLLVGLRLAHLPTDSNVSDILLYTICKGICNVFGSLDCRC